MKLAHLAFGAVFLALAACAAEDQNPQELRGVEGTVTRPTAPSGESSEEAAAPSGGAAVDLSDPVEPLAPDTDPAKPDETLTDEEMELGIAPPTAGDFPLPAIPAACATPSKVITYTPRGVGRLLDAFEKDHTPCASYYMFLPALVADKTMPRGGIAPKSVRSRAGRFFAVAEVHWQTWKNVTNLTWYQKGVEFRKRMAAAGYDVTRGDTWGINELPSTVRTDAPTRQAIRNMVQGLHDGPPGAPKRPGMVFVIGFNHAAANVSVLKQNTKSWLEDTAFWQTMDSRVMAWAQEAYAKPEKSCVASASIGERAAALNDFGMHPAKLVATAPAAAAAARKFFDKAYLALETASWKEELYGNTLVSLDTMKRMVSLEVYSQRAFASTHAAPDGRVGLSFHNQVTGATDAQVIELAERTAASISGAYGLDGMAARACSPSGAFTWCTCEVPGASFNALWNAFETW